MKTYWYYCLVAILFAASINTSAQAEEVSRKAADLMPKSPLLPTKKPSNSSNLVAQNNDSAANSINSQLPASNYWYLSGSVGGAFPNDIKSKNADLGLSLDSAFQWTVAGGYQWTNARAELEISNASSAIKKITTSAGSTPLNGSDINVTATTFFLNGYWDIPTGSKLRPYLGAGIGVGSTSIDTSNGQQLDLGGNTSFAYQGKLGVQYEVAKKGNAFVEFKYVGIGGYKTNNNIEIGSLDSYGVSVGYRQGF